MKPRKTPASLPLLLLPLLLMAGCASAPRAPLPVKALDHTAPLLAHPQFPTAAALAPDFVSTALTTITRLETELANAGR
jgi:hypothetical protein